MGRVHVVGDAAADGVELDAGADHVAVAHQPVKIERHVVGLENLDLQRHGEPVAEAAPAKPDEDLAGLDETARDQPLKPIEIEHLVGIRVVDPLFP